MGVAKEVDAEFGIVAYGIVRIRIVRCIIRVLNQ